MLILSLLGFSSVAYSQWIVTYNNYGHTQNVTFHGAYYVNPSPNIPSNYIGPQPPAGALHPAVEEYNSTYCIGGPSDPCYPAENWGWWYVATSSISPEVGEFYQGADAMQRYFINDPGGPKKGDTDNGFLPPPPGGWTKFIGYSTCTAALITAGAACISTPLAPICFYGGAALTGFCGGLMYGLTEHSPDWLSWIGGFDATLPDTLSIPFVVKNKGDGDWLSMSVNGIEFWRQPLSDFTEDAVYSAVVPTSLLTPGLAPLWNVSLESTGAPDAVVDLLYDIKAQTQSVPVPSTVSLFVGGLICLLISKKYIRTTKETFDEKITPVS